MCVRLFVFDVVLHLDFPLLKVRNCNSHHPLPVYLIIIKVPRKVIVNHFNMVVPHHQIISNPLVGEKYTSCVLVLDRELPDFTPCSPHSTLYKSFMSVELKILFHLSFHNF